MIRYDLVCANGHRFDAWFRNSGDFDHQAGEGFLACPTCTDPRITKALMTPGVRTARRRAAEPVSPEALPQESQTNERRTQERQPATSPEPAAPAARAPVVHAALHHAAMRQMARAMYDHVTKHARDVGKDFAAEARRQHEGEAEREGIYGQATPEDVEDLLEDGIAVLPLPVPPKADA